MFHPSAKSLLFSKLDFYACPRVDSLCSVVERRFGNPARIIQYPSLRCACQVRTSSSIRAPRRRSSISARVTWTRAAASAVRLSSRIRLVRCALVGVICEMWRLHCGDCVLSSTVSHLCRRAACNRHDDASPSSSCCGVSRPCGAFFVLALLCSCLPSSSTIWSGIFVALLLSRSGCFQRSQPEFFCPKYEPIFALGAISLFVRYLFCLQHTTVS